MKYKTLRKYDKYTKPTKLTKPTKPTKARREREKQRHTRKHNAKTQDCCLHLTSDIQCIRKKDKKVFMLPRRFTRKQCKNPRGFTMRSSCAPYRDCVL